MMDVAAQDTNVAANTVSAPEEVHATLVQQVDLFTLGREAAARTRALHQGRGVFSRSRQLLATGAWRGPRDAADAYVEESDLDALGGLVAAQATGVRTLLTSSPELARAATTAGLRCLWRVTYRAGEPLQDRLQRLDAITALTAAGVSLDALVPTAVGEAQGLDTLAFFALCRTRSAVPHLVADFARLGHRLAQMSLGFGANELFGPIVAERALRLGDNASNPSMTRKEAALLLRGAGLVPCERLSGGALEDVT